VQTPWFQWDDDNVDHFAWRGITPTEAEEALLDPRRIVAPAKSRRGEERWYALGATEEGRILRVVFTRRNGMVRVITALEPTEREKRQYRSRKGYRRR
jgi:uncharacterized DUF497 family protein